VQGKRITLIACVAANGSFVRTCLIVSRKNVEDELVLSGFVMGDNVDIYSQPKSYMDREIFYDWFKDSFIPDLVAKRARYAYDGPAYLILDNCSSHAGPGVDALCEANNVTLMFLPPHSSHFLQCLDVSLFGIVKNNIRKINKTEDVNVQTSHIIQVLNGFMSAATPTNIIKSYRNSGLSLRRDGMKTFCDVTPDTVRLYVALAPGCTF
jgi:hypothetical protein